MVEHEYSGYFCSPVFNTGIAQDNILALSQLTGEDPSPSGSYRSLHRAELVKDLLTRLTCLHHSYNCFEMASGTP
jgi:hypothetical protein